eukprot:5745822-Pleurochrysis_carterae.AAC.1
MHRLLVNAVLNALVLVVSLSWQDAITSVIDALFQDSKNSVAAQFMRALCVTALITFAVYLMYNVIEYIQRKRQHRDTVPHTKSNRVISTLG